MQAGARYQNQVTAWLAAKMLAERPAAPILPRGTLTYIAAESGEAIDDVLASTDQGDFAFVQAKRKISLSRREGSSLEGVVNQAVRQIAASVEPDKRPWSRALNAGSDRLLLVTSLDSPATIRTHLRDPLQRIGGLHPGQAIMDAAKNTAEKDALENLLTLLDREWEKVTGSTPTVEEQKLFLKLFDIEVLDPDTGEVHEAAAKMELAALVLEDPSQEHVAWTSLVSICGTSATRQTGFTLDGLRRGLRADNLALRAVPSFAADIEALRQHTKSTLDHLAGLSRIKIGNQELKVDRLAVTELLRVADQSSSLVVGQPGAGKSGATYDTARRLLEQGRDVICFAVDRLDFANLSQVRTELGLQHSLIDIIKAWDGNAKGVILIDALDAARGAAAGEVILSLIQELRTGSRWNVIASVRKWDLRYNPDLRASFRPTAVVHVSPNLTDPEFYDVTHVSVPVFSPEELDTICSGSPALRTLKEGANADTLELLRVPFNLRLAAELLDSGMEPVEFSPLRDQVGLLEAYWKRRVAVVPGGDAREQVLRLCLSDMVANRRLRTSRRKALEGGATQPLEQLLSLNVLSEWQASTASSPDRQMLAFAHNVLFDFGAAELYLPQEPADFLATMAAQPDLALLLRPSLHMRFQRLWMVDKPGFWELTFQLCANESLPALLQSCPLGIVAQNAKTAADVELLAELLRRSPADQPPGAARAYRHLVGVLVAGASDNRPDLGASAGPWLRLASDALVPVRASQAVDVQSWLDSALQKWGTQTLEQMNTLGTLARIVLDRVWSAENRNSPWAKASIKNVVITFGSDTEASASLLRRAFEIEHLMQHGHEELTPIAREAARLARLNPEFVRDLYIAAFGWQETSNDQTSLNQSRLMGFLSNRAQDYKHARWELAQRYVQFLEQAPSVATQALFSIVGGECRTKYRNTSEVVPFAIGGIATGIREDHSHIWDTGYGMDENAHAILNQFFHYLEECLGDSQLSEFTAALVRYLVAGSRDAILWRRLLELAARFPVLAQQIHDAASAEPLLIASDTERPMYLFIGALHPASSPEERERIENAIMDLGDLEEPQRRWGEHRRDTFLAALRDDAIVTERARTRIEELRTASALRTSAPMDPRARASAVAIDPEQFYEMRGISTEGPVNQQLVDLLRPVREFCSNYSRNEDAPNLEAARAVVRTLTALESALRASDPTTTTDELAHTGYGYLVEAASKIARVAGLDAASELGMLVQRTLDEGVTAHWPADGADDEHYEGGWSSLPGRIEAVEGLFSLLANPSFDVEPIIANLRVLAQDRLPVVRFQVAWKLLLLHERAPEAMWELIESLSTDPSYRVRLDVVTALDRCARAVPDRALALMTRMLDEAGTALGKPEEVRNHCIACLTCYHLWRDDPTAKATVERIVEGIPTTAHDAGRFFPTLRNALQYVEPVNPERALRTRERAAKLFNAVTGKAVPLIRELIAKRLRREELTPVGWTQFDDLERLLVTCSTELYYASGAFQENRYGLTPELTTPELRELYPALTPSWDLLAEIGSPNLVHHLVQTLEMYVPLDPARVFLLIGKAVLAGRLWSYHFEDQAVELVVRIIRTYIAEHRSIFEKNPDCLRVLRELLDLFITAGWPSARIVAYRVDEVFR
jgi:hypothetical protein